MMPQMARACRNAAPATPRPPGRNDAAGTPGSARAQQKAAPPGGARVAELPGRRPQSRGDDAGRVRRAFRCLISEGFS
ncbi:hypothetical protein HNQ78_002416 [Phycisphaera mikurensis]|nr:hypothetical protein [Phycisphaera mikurensis]